MHNSKEGINAQIDHKQQYKVYLMGKLCTYFKTSKADMAEDVDTTEDILTFPRLNEAHGFNHLCYTGYINRKKLNLDIFLDARKFAKTTILEAFLIGEGLVQPRDVDNYLFCFQIGGMYMVMQRGEEVEADTGMVVRTKDEGSFVIYRIEEFLATRWPKAED